MYCLDTNIILDIFKGDNTLKNKIGTVVGLDIFITPITLCELYKGAFAYHDSEKRIKEVDEFINSFQLIPFDEHSCKEFGNMYARLKKTGILIPEFDILIASLVKVNNLILVTRDKKHFEHLGIRVEVW